VNIVDAMRDPQLFKPWFKEPATWAAWEAFLCAMFGLPMTADQRALFTRCTGRTTAPGAPFNEAWLCCGRRSGKSFILALIAVYWATCRDWRPFLSPGERGHVLVLACDRAQARAIMRYATALLEEVALLAPLVERVTAEEIDLTNRVSIEITSASFRSLRGRTVIAGLVDEIAFLRDETSANPDESILAALRPAMATIPGAMLLCASSPYARRGAMWNAFRRYWGADDAPALFWQSATRTMNPTVPQAVVDEAFERDPASAEAEFNATFRSDVAEWISRAVVDAATVPGRFEMGRLAGTRYVGFCDPAGGSGSDSMTLAIAAVERSGMGTSAPSRAILAAVREVRPPFSPEQTTAEFAEVLRGYGLSRVTGDRYGGSWPSEQFAKYGIAYEPSPRTKSEIYVDALPILNSGRCELLDIPRLGGQLCALERRTARGGRSSVDHPPAGRDDLANAVCGSLVMALGETANTALARAKILCH